MGSQRDHCSSVHLDIGSVDGLAAVGRRSVGLAAPEKELTLFALQLAVLEKAASGLGALGFVWATVVLLGGFAIALEKMDFWFITVILLIESTRIFSRSHELEWQHQATWSVADVGRSSFRALRSHSRSLAAAMKQAFLSRRTRSVAATSTISPVRRWQQSPAEVALLPYAGWLSITNNVSRMLYWLQLLSATACVSLSLTRLAKQHFGAVDPEKKNLKSALNIFYGLALAEALLFLMEKAFWEWKVSHCRLLETVNDQCDLGPTGMVSIRRFFYDAYSRCVNGSIFDGVKMDLVSFAEELLTSSSRDEQLIGARILQKFATSRRYADETLRKLGTSTPAIERLVEMLNWKNPAEAEIRRSAAEVVSKLAGKKQNALRVAGIPGAMESISSLLYTGRRSDSDSKPDEVIRRRVVSDKPNYEFSVFNQYGLLILKKLANDHDNCGKIGSSGGLLAKIIDFTSTSERLLRSGGVADSQIRAVKRSLQVIKLLASTTGDTGKTVRREISEIIYTISNIREILQYGESHVELQKLGIEILTSLALEEDVRERIGGTGGMVRELLRLFFRPAGTEVVRAVSVEAGEALAMLALESRGNCDRILREDGVVGRLVVAVGDPVLRINSSRILRNLLANYADQNEFMICKLRGVIAAIPTVLNAIMVEEMKLLEVSIGLAAKIFRLISPEELTQELKRSNIEETGMISRLIEILKKHNYPSFKAPRIRRFVAELAISIMKSDTSCIELFRDLGMEKELRGVADTTSELECFNVFSGSVGLSRHSTTLCSLVDVALDLMHG